VLRKMTDRSHVSALFYFLCRVVLSVVVQWYRYSFAGSTAAAKEHKGEAAVSGRLGRAGHDKHGAIRGVELT